MQTVLYSVCSVVDCWVRCLLLLQEMLGELFTPVETPEAPNRGFFKGLFGGGAQSLDREELCMLNPHMHIYTVV